MTTHRERIQACLAGEIPDQTPVALWRHFPVDDQSPSNLAAAQIAFQRTFDFDLVKVTPASSFCLRDWGAEDVWLGATEGTRSYTNHVISRPQDWESLRDLDPSAPHLADQLDCVRLIRQGLGPDVPIIQTIFNPLAQAKNLAGDQTLLEHARRFPEALGKGLSTIARTTRRFVEAAIGSGIDGIFYAVQHAQKSEFDSEQFASLSEKDDIQILDAASGLWCNILHLHGSDIYFEWAQKYHLPVVNWHDRETRPSLAEGRKIFDGVVCGGLSRETLVLKDPQAVRAEKQDALRQTGGRKLILSTGCVVPITAPYGNMMEAK